MTVEIENNIIEEEGDLVLSTGSGRVLLLHKGQLSLFPTQVETVTMTKPSTSTPTIETAQVKVGRKEAVEYECSKTLRAMVTLTVECEKLKGGGLQVYTGSKAKPKFALELEDPASNSEITVRPMSFMVAPGESWFWEKTGAPAIRAVLSTYYLF